MLRALPRVFEKYLDIVVVAVWDIIPWPENLISNIATKRNATELIFEKVNVEIASNDITKKENFKTSKSSIFFPTQIKIILLNKVADA